jgi:hypothetical protein
MSDTVTAIRRKRAGDGWPKPPAKIPRRDGPSWMPRMERLAENERTFTKAILDFLAALLPPLTRRTGVPGYGPTI